MKDVEQRYYQAGYERATSDLDKMGCFNITIGFLIGAISIGLAAYAYIKIHSQL